MANELIWIIIAVLVVSSISLIGVATLFFRKIFLNKWLFFLVSFAAGAMLGVSFLDLLPEAINEGASTNIVFLYALAGIVVFFLFEKSFNWFHEHHHHMKKEHHHHIKTFAYLNLLGDGLHNFLDGMVIAVSFTTDFKLGIVSTFAVIFHEIPQEIGDFGILVHGGFTKWKALFFNFLSALTAVIGAVATFFFSIHVEGAKQILIPFAAGNFIYIACVNLIPELHHEKEFRRNMLHVLSFLVGILVIWFTTTVAVI